MKIEKNEFSLYFWSVLYLLFLPVLEKKIESDWVQRISVVPRSTMTYLDKEKEHKELFLDREVEKGFLCKRKKGKKELDWKNM